MSRWEKVPKGSERLRERYRKVQWGYSATSVKVAKGCRGVLCRNTSGYSPHTKMHSGGNCPIQVSSSVQLEPIMHATPHPGLPLPPLNCAPGRGLGK